MKKTCVHPIVVLESNPHEAFGELCEEIRKFQTENPTFETTSLSHSIFRHDKNDVADIYIGSAIIIYHEIEIAKKDDGD